MGAPLKILIMEDEEDDLPLLYRELKRAGYEVTFERVETIAAMKAGLEHQTWDLVISDYSLPGFTALDALQLVQSEGLDLPFIIVSGSIGEETAIRLMKAGAHDYIMKDKLARLAPAIERELREAQIRREKRQTEVDLLKAYENLELQVQQRTRELTVANHRLQAEMAEREQLAAIVESSNDAIISTSLDGRILSWNRGAEKMYGYSQEEVIGKELVTLLEIANPSPGAISEQQVLETLDGRRVVHQSRNGRLIDVFVTLSPMQDSLGRIIGTSIIARDITDQQTVERMKDEFVSIVSHELRTPLTSIRGSLGLILTGAVGTLPAPIQRMLEIAVNNTDRLVRLINDILDLEKLESGKIELAKQTCDIAQLIAQSIELMQVMAQKAGIQLFASCPSMSVWGDPDRILQVLTNLISNAIKFSPEGTEITIDVALSCSSDNLFQVLVSITDQGRGIPEDKLESIFDRFQQVDASDARQKGGTGLGLAICRSIVHQHGGRLWAESTLGKGSTFYLALPMAQEINTAISHSEFEKNSILTRDLMNYVLIIEDDPDLAQVMAEVLHQHQIQTSHARTMEEAMHLCEAATPNLLVLDLILPDQDGFAVVNWLRQSEKLHQIPLIIHSAYELDKAEKVRLQLGKTEFMTKGKTKLEELEKRVLALLKH